MLGVVALGGLLVAAVFLMLPFTVDGSESCGSVLIPYEPYTSLDVRRAGWDGDSAAELRMLTGIRNSVFRGCDAALEDRLTIGLIIGGLAAAAGVGAAIFRPTVKEFSVGLHSDDRAKPAPPQQSSPVSSRPQQTVAPARNSRAPARKSTESTAEASAASQRLGITDEIRELKQLFDEGALTQEEFDAAKRRVLGTES